MTSSHIGKVKKGYLVNKRVHSSKKKKTTIYNQNVQFTVKDMVTRDKDRDRWSTLKTGL